MIVGIVRDLGYLTGCEIKQVNIIIPLQVILPYDRIPIDCRKKLVA